MLPDHAAAVSELAMRSKAHWGYSQEFMEACRATLTLPLEYFAANPVYGVRVGERLAGFYSLIRDDGSTVTLDCLFVDPPHIGKGLGKQLWNHAVQTARELGYAAIQLDADPYAEPFYLAMGAERVGEAESNVFPGRMLPLMRYRL